MRKFIYISSLWVSMIFIFNISLFIFASKHYYNGYDKKPSKKIFKKYLFADSHGLSLGKDINKFGVYNFSAGSDSYFDIRRKLLYLIQNNYNIDTVYLTIDDHTLSPYREKLNNEDRSILFSSSSEFNEKYEFLKHRYFYYYFPISNPKITLLLKSYIVSIIAYSQKPNSQKKIKTSWHELTDVDRKNASTLRKNSQFPTDQSSNQLRNTLSDIIEICIAADIELIGIKFPLTASYIEALGSSNYGADSLFYVNDLTVLDMKSTYVNNPEYFSNQDHMNKKGGQELMKLLFMN